MKIHPNDFSLEEFLLSLSKEHLGVVEHLTRCATCRRRFLGFLRHRPGPLAKKIADVLPWRGRPADYSPVFQESQQNLQDRESAMLKERMEAPGLFVELTGYPPEQRDFALKNSPRFHAWGVFELLVERTLETSIQNPTYAEELGSLALRLSEFLDADYYGAALIEDLRARAWAYIGNSCRVRSDLQGAEEAFSSGYAHLRKGTRDSLERAVLLDLEASLRRDQRRFDEASRLLKRAISIFLQ
ncbi:MAG TPA: hypothetical protein VGG03_20685, partial [Thermoanaerobaculia bacterium]